MQGYVGFDFFCFFNEKPMQSMQSIQPQTHFQQWWILVFQPFSGSIILTEIMYIHTLRRMHSNPLAFMHSLNYTQANGVKGAHNLFLSPSSTFIIMGMAVAGIFFSS